jgi:hypothetical protein
MIYMCPDPQMLSLYYDGELPSPWKEKLEAHLAACSLCGDRLEQFRRLSGAMSKEPQAIGLSARRERVWGRLHNPAGVRKIPAHVWNRSVSVPLPLFIAAAAGLILVFSVFLARSGAASSADPVYSAMRGLDMQTLMPISDLSGVLQYLGNDDSPDIVIINLPESRSFMSSGEPAIIRAADYGNRRKSGELSDIRSAPEGTQ